MKTKKNYLQLDETADTRWFGIVVAANPFGQLICAPLIGWWCNKVNGTRIPSIACVVVFILANIWYGILPIHSTGGKYFILISRFLSGASSGIVLPISELTINCCMHSDREIRR